MHEDKPLNLFLPNSWPESRRSGVLPSQEIRELVTNGKICSSLEIGEDQIQPASIDLRLGRVAYRVEASFLPGFTPISAKIRSLQIEEIDITTPNVLHVGSVYVIPLLERLALPTDMGGKANPKSTTGRLDIFTRLMTEGSEEFEQVQTGYNGDLYLEVFPRTFSVVVQTGTKLNQLRFWRGNPQREDAALRDLERRHALVYYDRAPSTAVEDENQESVVQRARATIRGGVRLSLDLRGTERQNIVAYLAKRNAPPITLNKVNEYEAPRYWDCLSRPKSGRLVLQPGDFYLLASKERVSVPPGHAAEMEQYDPSIGEFSVHYAGFFDPGFGFGSNGEIMGTRAVLEVRAHEIPMLLEDGQIVGRLNYHRMADTPAKLYGQSIGSSYQQQGLSLSKQFKAFSPNAALAGATP